MRNMKYFAFLFLALLGVTSANDSLQFPKRVVSIGDVHGDLAAFVSILLKAEIIKELTEEEFSNQVVQPEECPALSKFDKGKSLDPPPRCSCVDEEAHADLENIQWRIIQEKRVERYRWNAKEGTVLVQTGDMLDRGMDTIAVYALLRNLEKQAKEAGSAVIPLLGNHETMNICGDTIGATKAEIATFGTAQNRIQAFSKNGFLGKEIRKRDSVAVVGGTVYSHAGVSHDFAKRDIAQLNEDIRVAMNFETEEEEREVCRVYDSLLRHEEGPHWSRIYDIRSQWGLDKACGILEKALEDLKADRMVVGHNPQVDGKLRQLCQGKLFLIDVAMSEGMRNCPAAALEMLHTYEGEGDDRVLTETKVEAIYAEPREKKVRQ